MLTATEIERLEILADWVILSACNTAAGTDGDPEALAGLTRAFLAAGARGVLVSHWYVNSAAAVDLVTISFAALKVDPSRSRAEALQQAMTSILHRGGGWAHPSRWAPFVTIGAD